MRKYSVWSEIASILSTTVLMSLHTWGIISCYVPDILYFVIPFVFSLLMTKDKWFICVFWTSVLVLIFFLTVSLSLRILTALFNASYEAMMQKTFYRILFVMVTNLALAALLYAISRFKKDNSVPYWPVLLLFLGTNAALLLAEESVYHLQMTIEAKWQDKLPSLLGVYLGLAICLMLVVFLYHLMAQSIERENGYQAEMAVIAQSKQYQEELSRMYTNLCHARHDMKQHYQLLQEIVASGANEKAAAYLEECRAEFEHGDLYRTGATAVDALILVKSLTMQKNEIKFRYSAYPLQQMPIKESAFCTILGNLLDNAIEGVLRLPPAAKGHQHTIHLTFSRSWDMFYIYCSNPCNEATLIKENDRWQSSKAAEGQPGFHSIGIRSIERLTNAAEGRCSFEVNNGYFIAKIVLPYTTEMECKS